MKPVAKHPRAHRDYVILDRMEAGLALLGTEVKAARIGRVSIKEAYGRIKDGEAWLMNAYFGEYPPAGKAQHDPQRKRKLLLHRRQILKLSAALRRKGTTLVPLRLYFNRRGILKAEMALARGRPKYDRREIIKRKEARREMRKWVRR